MSTYSETPAMADAINRLILEFGNEVWLYDAQPVKDDAGIRLQVTVDEMMYTEDVLPRRFGEVFIIVLKVPTKLVWECDDPKPTVRPVAQA